MVFIANNTATMTTDELTQTLVIILYLYYNSPYGLCLCLWRLFLVFTDRVLGRSLCEMSYNVPLDILSLLYGFGTLVRRLSLKNAVFAFSPVGVATGARSAADELAIK